MAVAVLVLVGNEILTGFPTEGRSVTQVRDIAVVVFYVFSKLEIFLEIFLMYFLFSINSSRVNCLSFLMTIKFLSFPKFVIMIRMPNYNVQ